MNGILYDYSPIKKQYQAVCRKIQEQIDAGNCRLTDLLDFREQKSRPSLEVFQEKGGTLWTQQYVGLFEYREQNEETGEHVKQRIVIGSRFDQAQKPFFLCRLLESFLGESVLTLEDAGGGAQSDFFDQLLTARLAVQIQRAWVKGGFRAYRSFPHNDSHIRGRPDIPRHIRENPDNGRMAYWTRSYSLDHPGNVLFLQACAAARKRQPELFRRLERRLPEFRAALTVLGQSVPGWEGEQRRRVLEQTRQRISNPIYREWEPARRIARAVLSRMGADPLNAEEGAPAVTGVFLNIDQLWERLLQEHLFRGAADEAFAQQSSRLLGGQMDMGIRPDFFFPSKRMVLDAKNRPDWGCTLTLTKQPKDGAWQDPQERKRQKAIRSAVREDIHQVLTYMLLLHCQDGGVIFPIPAECREPVTRKCRYLLSRGCMRLDPQRPIGPYWSSVGQGGLRFWRIAVRIPDAEDYPTFHQKLDQEFSRLRRSDPVRKLLS